VAVADLTGPRHEFVEGSVDEMLELRVLELDSRTGDRDALARHE
jgi:hypothetical protein